MTVTLMKQGGHIEMVAGRRCNPALSNPLFTSEETNWAETGPGTTLAFIFACDSSNLPAKQVTGWHHVSDVTARSSALATPSP